MSEPWLSMANMHRDAVISPDSKYRYSLDRAWSKDGSTAPRAVWIMLNPSTADAAVDDMTIRKCVGFSKRLGCNSLRVVNLFAWRATDPAELAEQLSDAIGVQNDYYISLAAGLA